MNSAQHDRDERLAQRLNDLFEPTDLAAAASNLARRRAVASRRKRYQAMTVAAIMAAGAVGFGTLRARDSMVVTADVGPSTTSPATSMASGPSTAASGPSAVLSGPTTAPGWLLATPLASDVEGRTYASAVLQPADRDHPLAATTPGLDAVRISFTDGTITGDNGACQHISGAYTTGPVPLQLRDVTQSNYTVDCKTGTDLSGGIVTSIIAGATPRWTGNSLVFTSHEGTLTLVEQQLQPSLQCGAAGESLRTGQIAGNVAASDDDPLAAARSQLAANPGTAGLVHYDLINLVTATSSQALIEGTMNGRAVLSAVMNSTPSGWALASWSLCAPSTSAATNDPGTGAVDSSVRARIFHITERLDNGRAIAVDPAWSSITFNGSDEMIANFGCWTVAGRYRLNGDSITVEDTRIADNPGADCADATVGADLAATFMQTLKTSDLRSQHGNLTLAAPMVTLILTPQ